MSWSQTATHADTPHFPPLITLCRPRFQLPSLLSATTDTHLAGLQRDKAQLAGSKSTNPLPIPSTLPPRATAQQRSSASRRAQCSGSFRHLEVNLHDVRDCAPGPVRQCVTPLLPLTRRRSGLKRPLTAPLAAPPAFNLTDATRSRCCRCGPRGRACSLSSRRNAFPALNEEMLCRGSGLRADQRPANRGREPSC